MARRFTEGPAIWELTLAVLAGGKGSRLGGVAKGLLRCEGIPFVERVLRLGSLCAEAMIVSGDPAYDAFGVRRVEDVEPGRGAPGGVVTALLAARTSWVLVVACDLPFVTLEGARALIARGGQTDVTCFTRQGQSEPLLAIYRASLGPAWRLALTANPSLRGLISGVTVEKVDGNGRQDLDGVNTPEEVAKVKS